MPIRTLLCVQFNLPDEYPVLVGKYNGEKLEMTAEEAVGAIEDELPCFGMAALESCSAAETVTSG
jgi:hypothetical protein